MTPRLKKQELPSAQHSHWHPSASRERPKAVARNKKDDKKEQTGYFRIRVRPAENFVTFRMQQIGNPGYIQRVAGQRKSGNWDTQTWLIPKKDARVEGNKLVIDSEIVLGAIKGAITRVKGDMFRARPKPKSPERITKYEVVED